MSDSILSYLSESTLLVLEVLK